MSLNHSLKRRYFFKVFTGGVSIVVSVITQSIIPRLLGAAQYGNLNFIIDFFTKFLGFFNSGSSIAFYTKVSKRPKEFKLVPFYFVYIAIATLLGLCFIVFVSLINWQGRLWPQIPLGYAFAAAVLAGITWAFMSMNDMADAYGLTVPAEVAKVFQRVLGLGLILILFFWKAIDVQSVFCFQFLLILFGILFVFRVIDRNGHIIADPRFTFQEFRCYAREFWEYLRPLWGRALVILVLGIFDRWLLQREGGSAEQGFFSLSLKVGAVCFLLTGSMTQLITREFSIAHQDRNIPLMASLFRRYIPLMFGVTAAICCFVTVNAGKVAFILGGREFNGVSAIMPVAIMALYPMPQTYGQISDAVFYATDQTGLYSRVTTIAVILGVPVTYFLIASPLHYGLAAGAMGLAVKTLLATVITTNVLLYFNARFLSLSFWWYVGHQLLSFITFFSLAFVVTSLVDHVVAGQRLLLSFMVSGACYFVMAAALVLIFPGILGLDRGHIVRITKEVTEKILTGVKAR